MWNKDAGGKEMKKEDAIKILNTVLCLGKCDCPKDEIEECLKMAIEALKTQPKTGHWIGRIRGKDITLYVNSEGNLTDFISCKCSECGEWLVGSDKYICSGRYCPSCGIKMQEVKK